MIKKTIRPGSLFKATDTEDYVGYALLTKYPYDIKPFPLGNKIVKDVSNGTTGFILFKGKNSKEFCVFIDGKVGFLAPEEIELI